MRGKERKLRRLAAAGNEEARAELRARLKRALRAEEPETAAAQAGRAREGARNARVTGGGRTQVSPRARAVQTPTGTPGGGRTGAEDAGPVPIRAKGRRRAQRRAA